MAAVSKLMFTLWAQGRSLKVAKYVRNKGILYTKCTNFKQTKKILSLEDCNFIGCDAV
jgi:hypothetical protein